MSDRLERQNWKAIKEFNERANLVELVTGRTEAKKAGRGVMIPCLNHSESTGSLYVTANGAYCFGCGKHYSPYDLMMALDGKVDIERLAPEKKRKEPTVVYKPPTIALVNAAHKALMSSSRQLDYLVIGRGLSLEILKEFKVGYITPPFRSYVNPRFCFPAWDFEGKLTTMGYRQDPIVEYKNEYPDNKRYVIHTGTQSTIYNAHNLDSYSSVIHCGGQIDALSLLQHGINATGAMGEGTFKPEWATHYRNKKVIIALDNDEAGIKSAQHIKKLVTWATIMEWGENVPQGYDINDAIRDKNFGICGIGQRISNLESVGGLYQREYKVAA